jgi:hypothetical protein
MIAPPLARGRGFGARNMGIDQLTPDGRRAFDDIGRQLGACQAVEVLSVAAALALEISKHPREVGMGALYLITTEFSARRELTRNSTAPSNN